LAPTILSVKENYYTKENDVADKLVDEISIKCNETRLVSVANNSRDESARRNAEANRLGLIDNKI